MWGGGFVGVDRSVSLSISCCSLKSLLFSSLESEMDD